MEHKLERMGTDTVDNARVHGRTGAWVHGCGRKLTLSLGAA